MAQLVNQICARCSQRVCDEFDARFCISCGNPVHDACAAPSADEGTCPVCGSRKDRAIAAQVLGERADPRYAPLIDPTIAVPQQPAPKKEEPSTMSIVIGMLYCAPLFVFLQALLKPAADPDPLRPPAEPDPVKIAIRAVMSLLCVALAFYLQRREARKRRSKDEQPSGKVET